VTPATVKRIPLEVVYPDRVHKVAEAMDRLSDTPDFQRLIVALSFFLSISIHLTGISLLVKNQ